MSLTMEAREAGAGGIVVGCFRSGESGVEQEKKRMRDPSWSTSLKECVA